MKKKSFKAFLSILLCLAMVFSTLCISFAKSDVTPVIVVSGMGAFPLYEKCDDGSEKQVWPPDMSGIKDILGDVIKPGIEAAVKGDFDLFFKATLNSVYNRMFDVMSFDENGNSKYEIVPTLFESNVGNHKSDLEDSTEKSTDEVGMIKALVKEVGSENVFYFNYDWRLSPLDIAEQLKDEIDAVKAETGKNEVILAPASMGGTVVNSYLAKYGNDGIKKIVYFMVASKGVDMVGELFAGNLSVSDADTLMEMAFGYTRKDLLIQTLVAALQIGLSQSKTVYPAVDKFVSRFISDQKDNAYTELLSKSLVTMPGMWAFVGEKYYDDCKKINCGDAVTPFTEKIDKYYNDVMKKCDEIMQDAVKNGTEIAVIASYGFMSIPVTPSAGEQSDGLIETKNESFGATCARFNEPWTEHQILATRCNDISHNHVSTDGIIDASTCLFADKTWFIKNNQHVGVDATTECGDLVRYVVLNNGVDVFSNEKLPQFLSLNLQNGKLTSLTGEKIVVSPADKHTSLFSRIFTLVLKLISYVFSMFSK